MADLILDALSGAKTYMVNAMASVASGDITIAWPDDRVAGDAAVEATKLTLSVYAFDLAPEEFEGDREEVLILEGNDPPIAQVTHAPLPFRLGIQVDTWLRTKIDDWKIQQEYAALMAAEIEFTTALGLKYTPRLEQGDNQDDLTAEGFHKVHRFSILLWIDDPHTVQEIALVLEQRYLINSESLIITAE